MDRFFGMHRVLGTRASTPQAAEKLNASLPAGEDELVLDVFLLNLDSTSAAQLERESEKKRISMASLVLDIVSGRGRWNTGLRISKAVFCV